MRDHDELFGALARSEFRSRFGLAGKERAYLEEKGRAVVLEHARGFVEERLRPARPVNDGKQTPMKNHPAFIAQHATATCCRGCLETWHRIPKGRELTPEEIDYIVRVIGRWLAGQEAPRALARYGQAIGARNLSMLVRMIFANVSSPTSSSSRRIRRWISNHSIPPAYPSGEGSDRSVPKMSWSGP